MRGVVRVRKEILSQMLEEARRVPEEECCGLLAGGAGVISEIFPARNTLASPTSYEVAPADLFRIFRAMRAAGLEHLGIYHSHPAGENSPSQRDLERAYYPDAAYFIISLAPDVPQHVRAFSIRDGIATELNIEVL